MELPPLLTLEARIIPTILADHELRALLRSRGVDLRLREELAARLVRAPGGIPDAILGLFLRVAESNRLVEMADDRGEIDGLGAAAGWEGATVGHAGPEAGVEALPAEDVAALEVDG